LDVCVVDRARFPRDKTCGDAISNRGVDILHELGAGAMVLAGPHTQVTRAAVLFPNRAVVSRTYAPPGLIVPRLHLDHALRQALEQAGATVYEGTGVKKLNRSGEVWQASGDGLCWQANLVIAADGPGSVAWPALGRPYPRGRNLAVAATAYFEGLPATETSEHYFEHELPCGYGWVFPPVNGLANVGVYQRSDRYGPAKQPLAKLLSEFLGRHQARLAGGKQVGKVRSWALPVGRAPWAMSGPGLLLTGDAAGLVDPLTGEGIWQALRSGQLAAEAVIRAGVDQWETYGPAYEHACTHEIARHCEARRWAQEVMRWVVARRAYRSRVLMSGLEWAYARGTLERTKVLR